MKIVTLFLWILVLCACYTNASSQVVVNKTESYISYTPMLFGGALVHIVHGYKASPYVTKTSQQLSIKDIKKAFGKPTS